jgi:probable rRNA maturation factor
MPEDGIDVRVAAPEWDALLGGAAAFATRVLNMARAAAPAEGEIAVLLADDETLRALNARWRGRDAPTNVLAFPAPAGFGLGDLALAHESVAAEARAQQKPVAAHAAHLLVHGYLHLLGYDHVGKDDAAAMEARERAILALLGVADPYVAGAAE